MCECVSVSVCLQFDTWDAKTNIGFFLSGNLDFGLEKSWRNHGTFFSVFCGNPDIPQQHGGHDMIKIL